MKRKLITYSILVLICLFLLGCSTIMFVNYGEFQPNDTYIVRVDEETIVNKDIKNEYSFLFLTDTHLVVESEDDTTEEKDFEKTLFGFTNINGIRSEEAFPYWVEYANQMKVDGVLLGGDILSYPTVGGVAFLGDHLNNLNCPYVYTFGNHDWSFPWEYLSDEKYKEMLSTISENQVLEYEDMIILALDDSADQLTEESLNLFKKYYDSGKKLILVMHVPISTPSVSEHSKIDWKRNISIGGDGITPNEMSNEFIHMVEAEDSPVICILDGHVHFYDRSVLGNDVTVQIVGDEGYGGYGILLRIKGVN